MKPKTQKHTPGPWELRHHPLTGTYIGCRVKKGEDVFQVVCEFPALGPTLKTHRLFEANARLIAASPHQNAVLRKIVERLDRWQRNGIQAGPKGKDADFEELKAEARAAIAKAEGRS